MNIRLAPIAAVAAFGFLAACATTRGAATADSSLRNEPERLIVVAVENPPAMVSTRAGSTPRGYDSVGSYHASRAARATIAAIERDYSLQSIAAWPIDALHVHCVVFRIPPGGERSALLARLAQDTRVRIAQPLQVFATSSVAYNDPYVELQNGFKALDIASAHEWSRGDGIRVAVIDTGIDTRHPDLAGRIVSKENFVDNDGNQFNHDRHGTGVAGVIAALGNNHEGIVGIAPGVKVIALKACWQLRQDSDEARCNSFTLAQALAAALNDNADVVNLSISGPADQLLGELIAQGVRRGIIFVGAAPRDGNANSFPVSSAGVLAVDAAEQRSNFRDALPAPGVDILTLTPDGHYDFASGASLATAHVTGAVALLLNRDHHLNTAKLHDLLQRSRNANFHSGSINACGALTALTARGSCQTDAVASNP
ncbi:MAG TPA: S8 family serine peptidase [Steroidobacteraceae bacterium]|nr:S8 family serine peptidase [Steroidobacteraceae bacterium]